MFIKLKQRVNIMLYNIKKKDLIEGYMMFNEDIRSKKSFQHKKYIINRCTFILMLFINRCTFILMLFMIKVTIDLFY